MVEPIIDVRAWRRVLGAVTLALTAGASTAGQMDAATYYLLRQGMSMSELLVRAGPPDLITLPGGEVVDRRFGSRSFDARGGVAFDAFRRSEVRNIEEWHYIPGPDYHDPWITVVTFRGGRISDVQRTKVFSRYHGAGSSAGDAVRGRERDAGSSRARFNRALEAAEDYAAIRSRLKEKNLQEGGRASEAPAPASTEIYRGTDVYGASYFGDVPLK